MVSEKRQESDQARKDRTRTGLLEAAGRVFVAKGYHATLISDIVQDAGLGQGTFYRFFTSKRHIFEALMEHVFERSVDQFADMSAHMPTNENEYREASLTAIQRLAEIGEQHRELILLFVRDAPAIDAEMNKKIRVGFSEFAGLARYYLDHAIERGFARPCDSAVVSQAIVGMGLRLLDLWGNGGLGERTLAQVIRELVDFAFLGFGTEGRS